MAGYNISNHNILDMGNLLVNRICPALGFIENDDKVPSNAQVWKMPASDGCPSGETYITHLQKLGISSVRQLAIRLGLQYSGVKRAQGDLTVKGTGSDTKYIDLSLKNKLKQVAIYIFELLEHFEASEKDNKRPIEFEAFIGSTPLSMIDLRKADNGLYDSINRRFGGAVNFFKALNIETASGYTAPDGTQYDSELEYLTDVQLKEVLGQDEYLRSVRKQVCLKSIIDGWLRPHSVDFTISDNCIIEVAGYLNREYGSLEGKEKEYRIKLLEKVAALEHDGKKVLVLYADDIRMDDKTIIQEKLKALINGNSLQGSPFNEKSKKPRGTYDKSIIMSICKKAGHPKCMPTKSELEIYLGSKEEAVSAYNAMKTYTIVKLMGELGLLPARGSKYIFERVWNVKKTALSTIEWLTSVYGGCLPSTINATTLMSERAFRALKMVLSEKDKKRLTTGKHERSPVFPNIEPPAAIEPYLKLNYKSHLVSHGKI